jgi:hypothetical protein
MNENLKRLLDDIHMLIPDLHRIVVDYASPHKIRLINIEKTTLYHKPLYIGTKPFSETVHNWRIMFYEEANLDSFGIIKDTTIFRIFRDGSVSCHQCFFYGGNASEIRFDAATAGFCIGMTIDIERKLLFVDIGSDNHIFDLRCLPGDLSDYYPLIATDARVEIIDGANN